ncbi:hypothetical protein H2201_000030 [Coniosporium apollinis]|uniref:Uncharacterized protein n=1 Tax=Coniosporium apollinis TaxID=61459 RepID=A0ABQ9P4Y1_9PEZI|nr:hypothetical protein H2201_000030 [Coniosporium apollinis]
MAKDIGSETLIVKVFSGDGYQPYAPRCTPPAAMFPSLFEAGATADNAMELDEDEAETDCATSFDETVDEQAEQNEQNEQDEGYDFGVEHGQRLGSLRASVLRSLQDELCNCNPVFAGVYMRDL